ncbi:hypothetical protein ACOMHN_025961 [Nucella lapillus]
MTSEGQDERPRHVQQGSDDVSDDVDLGACLEGVEDLQDDGSQHLYSDADGSPHSSAWVEEVIEMTSPGEMTSPSDHSEAAFNSGETLGLHEFRQREMLAATTRSVFDSVGGPPVMTSTDSAAFLPLQTTLSVHELQHSSPANPNQSTKPPSSTIQSKYIQSSSSSLASSSSSAFLETCDVRENAGPSHSSSDRGGTNRPDVFSGQASTSSDGQPGSKLKILLKSKLQSKGGLASTSHAERLQPWSRSPSIRARSHSASSNESTSQGDVPSSHEIRQGQMLAATARADIDSVGRLTSTDNAILLPLHIILPVHTSQHSCLAGLNQSTKSPSSATESRHVQPSSSSLASSSSSGPAFLGPCDVRKNAGPSHSSGGTSRPDVFSCQASTSSDGQPGRSQGARLKHLLKSKLQSKGGLASTSHADTERLQPWSHSPSSLARSHSTTSNESTSQDSDVTGELTCSVSSTPSSLVAQWVGGGEEDREDPVKLEEKREKNRLAAQKSRDKKRGRREKLEQVVWRLEARQERLREEVQALREERASLQDVVHGHGPVCPRCRHTSGDQS